MKFRFHQSFLIASLLTLSLLGGMAQAQSAVTVTLDLTKPGAVIPYGFSGISFETEKVLPDPDGHYFFRPDNTPLINLFKTLGIRSLRVGGNTADRPTLPVPGNADLDSLFGFAKAAGVKVLYTLRLRESDSTAAVAIAKHIAEQHSSDLEAFAVGNEPSGYTKGGYPAYHDAFQAYMKAVNVPGVAPDALFSGPGATGGTASWTRSLAADFGKTGHLAFVTQHYYPFGPGTKVTDQAAGRAQLLSAGNAAQYEKFYSGFGPSVIAAGVPYRMEEASNFYYGGAKDVSDTLAAALWGLDFLYWWASHGAVGVNFHAGDHVARGDTNTPCWYSPFWTAANGYAAHPLAYGLKAFDLGSHGRLIPATVSAGANLTAYAVQLSKGGLMVTLINKANGTDAAAAQVTLVLTGAAKTAQHAEVIFLQAPGSDAAAKTGITLGGGAITEDGHWAGTWSPLPSQAANGPVTVTVPAAAAAIVRLDSP